MIEIIMLIYLTRLVGDIVKKKNRKAGWYKFMAVLLWIGGEVVGGFIGGLIVALTGSSQLFIYLLALIGAATGALIAFVVAKAVPAVDPFNAQPPPPPTFG
jgi:MFS family permease